MGRGLKKKRDKKVSYDDYKDISDKEHMRNILTNPVKFLIKSGKGFFEEHEDYPIAIRKDLQDVVRTKCFARELKDVIDYRTMEYYRKRYEES